MPIIAPTPAPVTITAAEGAAVTVSGLDVVAPLQGWRRVRSTEDGSGGSVFEARVSANYSALFVDGLLQMSGRWPHTRLEDSWDKLKWQVSNCICFQ